MSYKNKHIVNFGLSDKDYQLLMFLFRNSHCSSVAEFFRFVLHEYFNIKLSTGTPTVYLDTNNNDIVTLKDILYEDMGVIKHD